MNKVTTVSAAVAALLSGGVSFSSQSSVNTALSANSAAISPGANHQVEDLAAQRPTLIRGMWSYHVGNSLQLGTSMPVLDIQLTKFGSDSVGTAIAAMFYANMKEIADSQLNVSFKTNALSHSLDVFKSKLGAFHPITIGCIQNLAWQYGERDYWEEAIVLEKHALVLIEHSMGTAHPEYLDARIRLSYTLLMGGEIDLATVNVTSLIDNWAQSHHPDHWGFGAAYSSLAVCLHEAGRNQEALENALLAFKILEPQYHLSSPEIIQLSRIMASIYTSQGNIEAANDWVNAQGQFSELASPMRTEMLEQEVWVWKFGQRYTY